ncbi:MAG: OsmC family protein [Sandaracinaceae bacterium]
MTDLKITLEQVGTVAFTATGETSGATVAIDGSPKVGGEGRGMRPTELFLSGLASCAAIDVVHILRRQKEPLERLRIEIVGTRTDEPPTKFVRATMRFIAEGDVSRSKLERAVSLSVEKYCTVRNSLDPAMEIAYEAVLASDELASAQPGDDGKDA